MLRACSPQQLRFHLLGKRAASVPLSCRKRVLEDRAALSQRCLEHTLLINNFGTTFLPEASAWSCEDRAALSQRCLEHTLLINNFGTTFLPEASTWSCEDRAALSPRCLQHALLTNTYGTTSLSRRECSEL